MARNSAQPDRVTELNAIDELNSRAWQLHLEDSQQAESLADESFARSKSIKYRPGQAWAFLIKGACSQSRSDFEPAANFLREAQHLFRELGDTEHEIEAILYLGRVRGLRGEFDKARALFENAYELAEGIESELLQVRSKVGLSVVYQSIGEFATSLEIQVEVQPIVDRLQDSTLSARNLMNTAINYTHLGDYSKAMELHQAAYRHFEVSASNYELAYQLSNIGALYYQMEEYEEALTYFNRSAKITREAGEKISIGMVLQNVGTTLAKVGKHDKALERYNEALAVYREIGSHDGIARVEREIGATNVGLGNYAEALSHFNTALSYQQKLGSKKQVASLYYELGRMYAAALIRHPDSDEENKRLNFEKAVTFFSDALELYEEMQSQSQQFEIHRELAAVYKARDQFEESLRHFELYEGIKADVFNRKKVEMFQNLEILHNTERARNEAEIYRLKNVELAEANSRLEELNAEKNEILGIAAHDLKNPIAMITMAANYLYKQSADVQADEIADLSSDIKDSAGRMFSIITNLLDVNRIEQGDLQLQPEPLNLMMVVKSVIHQYHERAIEKSINIETSTSAEPVIVNADHNALYQVLDNIISNAIKYSPKDKSVYIRCTSVETNKGSGEAEHEQAVVARLEIQDEGPGFTEKDKAKLFNKFARLSARPTGGEHSTGLGLSIVKKLVEVMNGNVWCESESGHGATFIVELPGVNEEAD